MKRLLCLALIFIMSLGIVPAGAISTAAAGSTPTLYVGGAVMRDGYYLANGADIATKVRPISGGYAYYKYGVLTLHDYECCGDGTVNSLDAAQILKLDAKLIEKFPVE